MKPASLMAALACVVLTADTAFGGVIQWLLVKGPLYAQTVNNTEPTTADAWEMFALLQTDNPGDATSVTITGGGIAGSMGFDNNGGSSMWELDFEVATQAELNATFPSSGSYILTLDGGALGQLTQAVTFGAEAYPDTPYLTGNSFLDAGNYDPSGDLTININSPGLLTQNNGRTSLEIADASDENDLFIVQHDGAVTTLTVPGGTLDPNLSFLGFTEGSNAMTVSGSGGFGVDGVSSHNVAIKFPIHTVPEPSTMLLCSAVMTAFISRRRTRRGA